MAKVIILSKTFPAYHPRKGEHTNFLVNAMQGYSAKKHNTDTPDGSKIHTIRNGNRWKKGDFASLRTWTDKPYCSKQEFVIEEDVELVEVYNISIGYEWSWIKLNKPFEKYNTYYSEKDINQLVEQLAKNDGLSVQDFKDWFAPSLPFTGQILVFGKDPEYLK